MGRYPHFLRRQKPGTFPTRIVALSADSDTHPSKPDGSVERETLREWFASGALLSAGVPGKRWNNHGPGTDSLWDAITYGLRHGQATLCVSYCCSRVWGLIGLWEMIENGSLLLESHNATEKEGDVHGVPMRSVRADPRQGERAERGGSAGTVPVVRDVDAGADHDMRTPRATRSTHSPSPILEDPPTIITVRHPQYPGRLTLVDCRNWGIECYPVESSGHERSAWLLDVVLRMVAMLRGQEMGGLKMTAGSQAIHTYRSRYMTDAIHCHTTPEVLSLESAAYVGGRCECLQIGKVEGRVYHLDYRSLYPSICARNRVPTCLREWGTGYPARLFSAVIGAEQLIADVTITTTSPDYPYRRDGDVIYPVGTFDASLAGPELADAIRLNRIDRWHRWAEYDTAPALREYAIGIWTATQTARHEADKPIEQWLKKVAVCLPGKFAQRGNTWVPSPLTVPARPWSQWEFADANHDTTRFRAIGWTVYKEVKQDWSSEAVPSIAAYVTSAGRMKLLEALRTAGREHCYYYDTDSLFCDQEGYDRLMCAGLVRPNALGYLRVIDQGDDLEIIGIKHYRFCGRLTCSGLPRGHTTAGPTPDTYWYRDWLKRSLTSGHRPHVERILREYARNSVYRHGEVQCDGRVRPLRIGNG